MAKLLVFDLDGTLIDSRQDIATSLNFALEQEGFPVLSKKEIHNLVGWGARKLVADALGNPSQEDLERVFQSFWKYYDQHLLDETALYPDVLPFLDSTENWHRAVITNKPEGFTHKILKGLKLDSYFDWIFGGDSMAVRKPDPAVLDPIRAEL
ncbi:MAG: HAD hydrolase-like protein, partial [bacterium]|nr:HAD hydrolase-like protein [bacterium]